MHAACFGAYCEARIPIGASAKSNWKPREGSLMKQHELSKFVCALLDRLNVAYMVTESQATIAYGEPRFTNDIDIIVDLTPANVELFCDGFPDDDFYLSRPAAIDAFSRRGMFNVIHPASGLQRVRVTEDFDVLFSRQKTLF